MSATVQSNGYTSSNSGPFSDVDSRGPGSRKKGKSWHGIQSFCNTWVMLVIVCFSLHRGHAERIPMGKICGSIDVRNYVSNFEDIRNCSIIDGSLSIVLIDFADETLYEDLSFPMLVEITDYLLLYRVHGLKSLSHIFPNLSVIRGLRLFFNYALVVYEMPDYEDIGLPGLVSITRGSVRLEKNKQLCYVDTIDWKAISGFKQDDNFIVENKKIDECVNVCPKDNSCAKQLRTDTEAFAQYNQTLCWNSNNCQKTCHSSCGSRGCEKSGTRTLWKDQPCCHQECLGGCYGKGDTRCIACRHVFFQNRCLTRCPSGTYMYRKHRCLTEDQCKGLATLYSEKWKVVEEKGHGQCLLECPVRYRESTHDPHRCELCVGPCPKVCSGSLTIDSVEGAQNLKGCTIIKGNLEIQIRGGSEFMNELEKTLGQIQEITGYLRFWRSNVKHMNFLKSLRVIHGEEHLFMEKYALFVLDNQNLEDIWDFQTHPNLTITRGKAAFHFNRKLCLNKIYHLLDAVGVRNSTDENDVSPSTNGDLVACDITELKVEIVSVHTYFAVIRWNNFKTADLRQLLNYVINYIEAPEQNITIFNARDACGNDQWHTVDVLVDEDPKAFFVAAIMYHLKPFTQYAVYVQTYTISTATQGALSPIQYFITLPGVPTSPRNLKVNAVHPQELVVTWDPPIEPKGNVTHYEVYFVALKLDAKKFDQRNYCVDKVRVVSSKKNPSTMIEKKPERTKNNTASNCECECPRTTEVKRVEEEKRLQQIQFENYLHNTVYIKQDDEDLNMPDVMDFGGTRNKRSLPTNSVNMLESFPYGNDTMALANGSHPNMTTLFTLPGNGTLPDESMAKPIGLVVAFKEEVVLVNLSHFTEYSIEVIACLEYREGDDNQVCSHRAITHARTQPKVGADNINPLNISIFNHTKNSPKFIWQDPENPNGVIVTYDIELVSSVENFQPRVYCISHKKYREVSGYQSTELTAGNWSLRIRATSLASNGSWTQPIYFIVPEKSGKPFGSTLIAVISVCAGLLVIAIASMMIWFFAKKRFNPSIPDGGVMIASVNPDYFSPDEIYVADDWEVPRDKIQLIQELGQGSFGMVYEGIAKGIIPDKEEIKVAVKTVNENASIRDRIEFLNEASIMKAFNTSHVVKLLGVVSKGQPTLVVMELMAHGDLKCFLRQHRPDEEGNEDQVPPTLKEILQMAAEIADGMAYLSAKKFVHRDLAARNCMVSDNMVVKIGDFGMTRDIYETDYYRKGGRGLLPVRWMAPESLKDGVFTSQCDVWSYGVVLWEMATLAAQPYQGLANEQVLKWVLEGGIMDKPEGCPDKLYNLMLMCWRHVPRHRPTFCDIISILDTDLRDSFKEKSFFYSVENQEHAGHPKVKVEDGTAGNDSMQKEFPEDVFEMDDSQTPLTSSPKRLQFNVAAGLGQEPDKEEMDFDDDFDQLEAASQASSSLSYHSQHSPAASRPCLHDQPCECVELMGSYSKVKPEARDSAERWSPDRFRLARNSEGPDCDGPQRGAGNDGSSKESSKSSGSSQSGGRNGMMNGHIPRCVPHC